MYFAPQTSKPGFGPIWSSLSCSSNFSCKIHILGHLFSQWNGINRSYLMGGGSNCDTSCFVLICWISGDCRKSIIGISSFLLLVFFLYVMMQLTWFMKNAQQAFKQAWLALGAGITSQECNVHQINIDKASSKCKWSTTVFFLCFTVTAFVWIFSKRFGSNVRKSCANGNISTVNVLSFFHALSDHFYVCRCVRYAYAFWKKLACFCSLNISKKSIWLL